MKSLWQHAALKHFKTSQFSLFNYPGVYIIMEDGEVVKIGRSDQVQNRVASQKTNFCSRAQVYFKFTTQHKILERQLIRRFWPPDNIGPLNKKPFKTDRALYDQKWRLKRRLLSLLSAKI